MPEERRIDNNEELIREADTTENLIEAFTNPRPFTALQNYGATEQVTPLVDPEMSTHDRAATAYATKCCICGEEVIADSYANLKFVCPHCKDAVKWLKNHIDMLKIILNKEWK